MQDDLLEWILRHIKQKDVFFKKIVEIESADRTIIHYQDKKVEVLAYSNLDSSAIEKIIKTKSEMIVAVSNTKSNIDAMIKNWDELTKIPGLRFYFINLKVDDKWIISPHTHHKISERKSLRKGLVSLSQNVPLIP